METIGRLFFIIVAIFIAITIFIMVIVPVFRFITGGGGGLSSLFVPSGIVPTSSSTSTPATLNSETYVNTRFGYVFEFPKELTVFESMDATRHGVTPAHASSTSVYVPHTVTIPNTTQTRNEFFSVVTAPRPLAGMDAWIAENYPKGSIKKNTVFFFSGKRAREITGNSREYPVPVRSLVIEKDIETLVIVSQSALDPALNYAFTTFDFGDGENLLLYSDIRNSSRYLEPREARNNMRRLTVEDIRSSNRYVYRLVSTSTGVRASGGDTSESGGGPTTAGSSKTKIYRNELAHYELTYPSSYLLYNYLRERDRFIVTFPPETSSPAVVFTDSDTNPSFLFISIFISSNLTPEGFFAEYWTNISAPTSIQRVTFKGYPAIVANYAKSREYVVDIPEGLLYIIHTNPSSAATGLIGGLRFKP